MAIRTKQDTLPITRRLFTTSDYQRLFESGVLSPDEHTQLVNGEVFTRRPPARRLFTAEEYHRMAETGILSEDERVELIDGQVVQMSPIGSRHAACVAQLDELLRDAVGKQVTIMTQSPVELAQHLEPQPDLLLLKRRADFYRRALPKPEDVLLLIEVSDSTLDYDREVKVPLYARVGIPETWIVNLQNNTVEVYSQPGAQGYSTKQIASKSDSLALPGYSDLHLSLDELFD